jgi:hypothetical protein
MTDADPTGPGAPPAEPRSTPNPLAARDAGLWFRLVVLRDRVTDLLFDQLAADALGDDALAREVAPRFQAEVLARIDTHEWQLSDRAIQAFARRGREERRRD